MRKPVIVVTGGIATGKSTVARVIAGRGGTVIDCDAVGHAALESVEVKPRLERAFGKGILTPSGRVSRLKLGRIVFSEQRKLDTLNRLIRPTLRKMIGGEISRLRRGADYIVLDAVLYFQYTFRFKVDLVVQTLASKGTRLKRLMARDGMGKSEAYRRIERQEPLTDDWRKADITIRTDGSIDRVIEEAARIRDRFLDAYRIR
jgi:dephospho-CoA kinase